MRQSIIFIVIIVFYIFNGEMGSKYFWNLTISKSWKRPFEKIMFEKNNHFSRSSSWYIKYSNNPVLFITPKLYSSLSQNQHTAILKELKSFFSYYYLPMNTKSDLSINYEKRGTKTSLKRQPNYRFGICQMLGVKRLYLFPPNSKEDLYYDKTTDQFGVDFWNQDIDKFPRVSNAKFIEIPISPGQIIFIPKGWIFCYEMEEKNGGILNQSFQIY